MAEKKTKNQDLKFDPMQHLIDIASAPGETKKYLEVKWRMHWFRQEHPEGLIKIELMKVTDNEAVAKAEVYLNKEDSMPVAVNFGSASKAMNEYKFVESACTYAKGRALADAGYNVVDIAVADEEDCLNPCDSPIRVPASSSVSAADKEAALNTVIPFGQYEGNLLNFIDSLENRNEMLSWYIGQDNGMFPDFQKACKVLLQSAS